MIFGGFWIFVFIFLPILTVVLLGWGVVALYKKIFKINNPKDIKRAREEFEKRVKNRRHWN